jgi:hypothetical protein
MSIRAVRSSSSARFLPSAVVAAALVAVGCDSRQAADQAPHVQHVNLSPHKVWKVISVQPYAGLEEVELVRVDWPTAQDPRLAFALTREDLQPGDPICLDHIVEIDTLWAHPVPDGGCSARD